MPQDSEFVESYMPGIKSLKPYVDEFFSLLDSRIKYDRLKINTLQEFTQKFFLTDHHWNAYGAYEGYCDIIKIMSAGNPRSLGELHIIKDSEWHGSNARVYAYYEYTDNFFFYDYKLPPHIIETTKDYPGFDANMSLYLNDGYSKSPDMDYYSAFYPYASYICYPENNTRRKVLMLTDSFSRGVSELLGSNFDEMFVYDYRRMNEIGNYNEFIKKRGITDVLVMQTFPLGVFNRNNDNGLCFIIT